MTHDEWLAVAATIARTWPATPLLPGTVQAWWPLVADLDASDVRAGLLRLAAEPDRRFHPAVGEIRATVVPPDGWETALARLAGFVAAVGYYGPAPALEPGLQAVVESFGGWRRLCERFDAADSTTRAQFRDAWRSAARMMPPGGQGRALEGSRPSDPHLALPGQARRLTGASEAQEGTYTETTG